VKRHAPLQFPGSPPGCDPPVAARAAGLRYVTDTTPGVRRRRAGKNFGYVGVDGRPIREAEELRRISALAIPPAWSDVWICPFANGHLQATGRDSKGRKQYRYHTEWRAVRDETKYTRMITFAQRLPHLRRQVGRHLARAGLPREKVLATVVRLLDTTYIRVGNEEYVRTNQSFGLTTMRDQHVDISGTTLRFNFRGKSGKYHAITLSDRRLATIVRRCQDLPGSELFQYLDNAGQCQTIDSADVNAYIREVSGQDCTAKDFRTWAGTILAAVALRACGASTSQAQAKKHIGKALTLVAGRLGNTVAVCRKCYVHPAVFEGYLDGSLLPLLTRQGLQGKMNGVDGLSDDEWTVLSFLRQAGKGVGETRAAA
jgi:DNA topoisomerase I